MALDRTAGHIITGVNLDKHRFIGRVQAAQLFQFAPNPLDTENAKKVSAQKELQDILNVREEVQRLFEGAKKKNVPAYRDYVCGLYSGDVEGITPPITLYSEQPLQIEEEKEGAAFIQVPWDARLVAIDGETQLAARHEAGEIAPDTKKEFVPVYICHGRDKLWARQAFHDLNTLAVRPNVALSIGMDARDPITTICREVERLVPFFSGRVNKQRRQLRDKDPEVATISSLRGACVTFAKGISGVQYGARPVPINDADIKRTEIAAIDWFNAVTEAIGPALSDRVTKLAASPSVLAAIGAIGHPVIGVGTPEERKAKCRQLANELRAVNWERGPLWEGIAGKFTPKGAFTIGGAKETSYAIYSALTDPMSAGFSRVRPSSLAA